MLIDRGQIAPVIAESDHVQGSANAQVTLVEYGDFECPHCGRAYPIIKEIQRRLGAELRFVYRHFPLRDVHPHAQSAAEAAEAAGAQGEFWWMHDILFENQSELDDVSLIRYAERTGLDVRRFALDLQRRTFSHRVQQDHASGVQGGVHGTPTFFIDGIRHDLSFDLETLLLAIESAVWQKSVVAESSY
jgi:protein-disulfide isomerase